MFSSDVIFDDYQSEDLYPSDQISFSLHHKTYEPIKQHHVIYGAMRQAVLDILPFAHYNEASFSYAIEDRDQKTLGQVEYRNTIPFSRFGKMSSAAYVDPVSSFYYYYNASGNISVAAKRQNLTIVHEVAHKVLRTEYGARINSEDHEVMAVFAGMNYDLDEGLNDAFRLASLSQKSEWKKYSGIFDVLLEGINKTFQNNDIAPIQASDLSLYLKSQNSIFEIVKFSYLVANLSIYTSSSEAFVSKLSEQAKNNIHKALKEKSDHILSKFHTN